MSRWLVVLALVGATGAASAQPIVIDLATAAPASPTAVDQVARLAGPGALRGPALAAAIVERVSAPAQESDSSPLNDLQNLVMEGIDDFYQNRFNEAVDKLTRAGTALRAAIDVVGREERAAQALFESQIILAITLKYQGHVEEAREVIRHCIRTFPERRPMLAQFSPDLIRFYDEVKSGMDAAPRATLKITTEPPGCVVLRDGQAVGTSPFEGTAYPGAHTLQVRCAGRLSGVRRLTLAEGPRDIHFDAEADAALRGGPIPWIQAGPAARRAAAQMGRELGRDTVILVSSSGGRASIEVVRSDSARVERRGTGDNVAAAWAGLEAVRPEGERPDRPEPGPTRTPWYLDVPAWAGIGIGALTAVTGLALLSGARDDAREAYQYGSSDPTRYYDLSKSAKDAGVPGMLLMTSGTGLALGSVAALATPSSDHPGPFHGPWFWVMSAAGLVAASTGVGMMALDGCDYDDHSFCPAVLDHPLASNAPTGAVLTVGGAVVLTSAIVLRLVEK
ncbi:MAG: hypothetical protein HYY06_11585 [Deltaproteobacteria bacterium]|nr:hypothetical protein [Deltaproteobacteria bacterium]